MPPRARISMACLLGVAILLLAGFLTVHAASHSDSTDTEAQIEQLTDDELLETLLNADLVLVC